MVRAWYCRSMTSSIMYKQGNNCGIQDFSIMRYYFLCQCIKAYIHILNACRKWQKQLNIPRSLVITQLNCDSYRTTVWQYSQLCQFHLNSFILALRLLFTVPNTATNQHLPKYEIHAQKKSINGIGIILDWQMHFLYTALINSNKIRCVKTNIKF